MAYHAVDHVVFAPEHAAIPIMVVDKTVFILPIFVLLPTSIPLYWATSFRHFTIHYESEINLGIAQYLE